MFQNNFADGGLRPVFYTAVYRQASPRSVTEAEIAAVERLAADGEPYLSIQLQNQSNETLFRDFLRIDTQLRAEFQGGLDSLGGGSVIEAYSVPSESYSFAVRVPLIPETTLLLGGLVVAAVGLDDLAEQSDRLELSRMAGLSWLVEHQGQTGNPANRLDLLIIGEGYTAQEMGTFNTQVDVVTAGFFAETPYQEYQDHFNVTGLFVESPESGADHPPYCPSGGSSCCTDPAAQSDPRAGLFVNTAFDATFCAFQIHRLLVVNTSAVLAAASASPDWDSIMVIVNDPVYGGSGGFLSVISAHSGATEIARHELGHSFSQLADEYESPYPGFPPCSDITGPACEVNVTDQTNPALIKWLPWITPGVPIPTPEEPLYDGSVGLFEGARYQTTGVYRPRLTCRMRAFGAPFCQICTEQFILRLYSGGWGEPAGGVDPIEPGSENPPPGDVSTAMGSVTLSVELLQPIPNTLAVNWSVDGTPVPMEHSNSFVFTPPAVGTFQVRLDVEDSTALIQDTDRPSTSSFRLWSVTQTGSQPCYSLTRNRTGSGGNPTANPSSSVGCPSGQYFSGELIQLTASPASGWTVSRWSGTDNDSNASTSNTVTMPAAARTVTVHYARSGDLTLLDDDFEEIPLPFSFPFCGTNYDSVFVGSNGILTFGSGSTLFNESVEGLLADPPRIAALWDDLNPGAAGTVSVGPSGADFAVTFSEVPEFPEVGANSFTVLLKPNGYFTIGYGSLSATDGLVGRSMGAGAADFGEVDLSSASEPITGPSGHAIYELFNAFDNDLANLVLDFAACSQETACVPPTSGDWIVASDCVLGHDASLPAGLIVIENVTLTLAPGVVLDIDLSAHRIVVATGARVVLMEGARIR